MTSDDESQRPPWKWMTPSLRSTSTYERTDHTFFARVLPTLEGKISFIPPLIFLLVVVWTDGRPDVGRCLLFDVSLLLV